MPWPRVLQGKTLRFDCKVPDGDATYVEMNFHDFPADTGQYMGDYQGNIQYVAHGSCSDGGLVVVFQWEDSFKGPRGLQTIWLEEDRLLWYQGVYFTFDCESLHSGWSLEVGEVKKYWEKRLGDGSVVSSGEIGAPIMKCEEPASE